MPWKEDTAFTDFAALITTFRRFTNLRELDFELPKVPILAFKQLFIKSCPAIFPTVTNVKMAISQSWVVVQCPAAFDLELSRGRLVCGDYAQSIKQFGSFTTTLSRMVNKNGGNITRLSLDMEDFYIDMLHCKKD